MQQNQHQYLPVHWMDGMKMNKTHFISQNNAYTAQIAQSVGGLINKINYGLLPATGFNGVGSNGLKISVSTDNQHQVQVRLYNCVAITRGGYMIQVDEQRPLTGEFLSAGISDLNAPYRELIGKTSDYLVVLTVNPYERIPYGQIDPAEMPPRIPYTLPTYSLGLVSTSEVTS